MNDLKNSRLVRNEHLNHHGTLYAGRLSEWFVESCFICAARSTGKPERLVCREILDLTVTRPTKGGVMIEFSSRVARAGKTSLIVFCAVADMDGRSIAEGFISFVSLDENGKPSPHMISLDDTVDYEELAIRSEAENLFKSRLGKRIISS